MGALNKCLPEFFPSYSKIAFVVHAFEDVGERFVVRRYHSSYVGGVILPILLSLLGVPFSETCIHAIGHPGSTVQKGHLIGKGRPNEVSQGLMCH